MPRGELPDSARCVIVGGGVGGTSLALHLTELGWDDVVLLDRSQLEDGRRAGEKAPDPRLGVVRALHGELVALGEPAPDG